MNHIKKLTILFISTVSTTLFVALLILLSSNNANLFQIDNHIAITFFESRTTVLNYLFVLISYLGETFIILFFCILLLLLPNRKRFGIPITIVTLTSILINLIL